MAQLPLLDVRVKPSPEVVAVKVAQVPVVYHFPAEMMQPVVLPPVCTLRTPLPLKGEPVNVAVGAADVPVAVVEVGLEDESLGRYLMPVDGQADLEPSGSASTNVPLCTLPRTLK